MPKEVLIINAPDSCELCHPLKPCLIIHTTFWSSRKSRISLQKGRLKIFFFLFLSEPSPIIGWPDFVFFYDWSIADEEPVCSKSFLINHFLTSDFLLQNTFSFRHFRRTWLLGRDNSFYFFYLFVLSYLVFYFTIKSPILAVKRPNTTQSNNWYKLVYSSRLITPRVEKGCKTWKVLKSFTLPRK